MDRIQIVAVKERVDSQSRPYIALGEDLDVYYCKFAIGNCDEMDLYHEHICKKMGDLLGIPIPDACLMTIDPEPFVEAFAELNTPLLGFGSKEIWPNRILAAKTDFLKNKHDFNRIPNPEELIKIGIFDLHFKNMDRSDANFNLIQSTGNKDASKIYAIDHVQCFGGNAAKHKLQPVEEESIGANILRTDYGKAVCKYLGEEELNRILTEYFTTFNKEKKEFPAILNSAPAEWNIHKDTKLQLGNFVLDEQRNESVIEAMKTYFAFV